MNPLLGLMGSQGGGSRIQMFMKAFAAYSRGESAEDFLKSVARTDPRFQGLDLNNLEQTANQLCQKKGVNPQQALQEVQNEVSSLT